MISSGNKAQNSKMKNNNRVRQLKKSSATGAIIYWMSREQRVQDNWSLVYAQELAIEQKQPLLIYFYLHPVKNYNPQHYLWMLTGLEEVAQQLETLNIPFIVSTEKPVKSLSNLVKKSGAAHLVADLSPLSTAKKRLNSITTRLNLSVFEVDARNTVPVWEVMDKQAYAASSIRARLVPLLHKFYTDYPQIKPSKYTHKFDYPDFQQLKNSLRLNSLNLNPHYPVTGSKAANQALSAFLDTKLSKYSTDKNNPLLNATSQLSAYLHFGQLSALRVLLEYKKRFPETDLFNKKTYSQSFLDEIIIRKELAENYCYFNNDYRSIKGAPIWGYNELKMHEKDKRDYLYTYEDLQDAKTHDQLWNACQIDLVETGFMPGYLRMYWAKKFLEWTASPEKALEYAIRLNDYYSLDGRDPNGYAGIQWAISGLHDHPWKSRMVFGKIRYMGQLACKKKFDIKAYIKQKQLCA